MQKTPVLENLEVNEAKDGFNLLSTKYQSFGVGLPFLAEEGDFREEEVFEKLLNILNGRQVDVVISDMAPNTSGNRAVDQPRQIYLCELALDFAQKVLGPNGQFIVKVFQGSGFDEFRKQVVDSFDVLKTAKPAASRARSKEVFLIGQGRKKALQ